MTCSSSLRTGSCSSIATAERSDTSNACNRPAYSGIAITRSDRMKSKLAKRPYARSRDRVRARVVARVRELLSAGGCNEGVHAFDLDAWVDEWMQLPMQELHGESPARAARSSRGRVHVEQLLDRMTGGLCA